MLGMSSSNAVQNAPYRVLPLVKLTNTTTVTASANLADTAGNTLTVSYEVVQFKSAKVRSVQYAEFNGTTTNTTENVTISSVTVGDCLLINNGANVSLTSGDTAVFNCELTSATNVAFVRGLGTSVTAICGVTVVELIGTFSAVENITATGYSTSGTTADTTITAASNSSSFLTYQNFKTTNASNTTLSTALSSVAYTSSTNMRATRVGTLTLTGQSLKARSHTFVS